ncbi:DNA-directed RNA polymerase subunit L [Methanobrevibacter filiformis]|uniref:DNA-directed RNA polymerase subunit Rpo11 n=1 Tax=Methanobrevibacter filiformis TaxID=55758 RepID=A0A166A025_9EURY|nr:DNA-directed RNA polymerase subunit L [Methanobrevibacter filiformis]KZX11393.1 DNA-directed RNA polymerase subunit L [Methanobrevibacter filiformis]
MKDMEPLKNTKTELEIKMPGESHSICNVLRKYLMEDESVRYAVYGIDHPIVGEPILTIKANQKKSSKNALLKASTKLKEQTEEFKKILENDL